jgi:hypothetical protein
MFAASTDRFASVVDRDRSLESRPDSRRERDAPRFYAEHSAIAAMVTAGEYRMFIRQVDPANLDERFSIANTR